MLNLLAFLDQIHEATGSARDSDKRRLLLLERKVAYLFERLNADPAIIEAQFRREEEEAARQSEARSLPPQALAIALFASVLGAAIGVAVIAWARGWADNAGYLACGGAIGAMVGFLCGCLVHDIRTCMQSKK